jgi:LPS export ABC transporter protein LptC
MMRGSAYSYLVVGAIALGSWWLASTDSHHTTRAAANPPAPGYYFEDARLTETDAAGQTILTLHTRHAEQDVQSRSIRLRDIAVDYHSAPDAEWHLQADSGSMPVGADILTLRGHVELRAIGTRNAGAVVHTDRLSLDRTHHIAYTEDDALIDWPPHQISARGFNFDLTRRTLALEHSVHGTFHR